MSNEKYTTIHYRNYLELDKILDAQYPRSLEVDGKEAHEEMLFIIVHQVYELWFKQIIHELDSVSKLFADDYVDEKNLSTVIHRLERVIEIQKLLVAQIGIMETMTPLDFLDFRNHLFPASGFQSYQFRAVENMLGLQSKKRLTYNGCPYASVFSEAHQQKLSELEANNSLYDDVESWLERTPFLKTEDFDFLVSYKDAVEAMVNKEAEAIKSSPYLRAEDITMRLEMLGNTSTYFQTVFDENHHKKMQEEGKLRMSYKATIAALLIHLYRDEPLFNQPHRLLNTLINIDDNMTTWRYRHAQMVQRMLGNKIGTGGSSGHEYLLNTALNHSIFKDLHNISTLLIPRSELPELPQQVKDKLSFYFTQKTS